MSDVLEKAAAVQLALAQVEERRAQLLQERRQVISEAQAAGHTYREIGERIKLSPQRAQRAVNGNAPKKRRHAWPADVEL